MNKVSEKVTNHRHKNHLTLFIFRRASGSVICTSEKWNYERWIYSSWKILSDNLGVKSESLTWLVCRNKSVAETWLWHTLGWCPINFIKPKTYSALLPSNAYDSPHLGKEFMSVTRNLLQMIAEITTYIWHIPLPSYVDYLRMPPVPFKYNDLRFENPTTTKTNIWANISLILKTKALTSTSHSHVVELYK
jgi:hypothetical protein